MKFASQLSVLGDIIVLNNIVFANIKWLYPVMLIGLFVASLTLFSYRNSSMPWRFRGLAIALRLLGIGLLLLSLLEPMGAMQRPRSQANVFAILVDDSQSMKGLATDVSKTSLDRFDHTLSDDSSWQRKLAEDFRVRRYMFDSKIEPVETFQGRTYQGNESAIYRALQSLSDRYQGQPLAGVILLTDGNSTDSLVTEELSKINFPVYPVRVGELSNRADIRIASTTTKQSDFETSPVTIHASLLHRGFEGQSVMVDLIDSKQKVVQTQSIKLLQEDKPVVVDFRFRPEETGVQGYSIVARQVLTEQALNGQALTGQALNRQVRAGSDPVTTIATPEVSLENNRRFEVVDRGIGPYRILYIAGRPNWEYKFLKRALDEDDEIRLTSLIRIARKEPKFSFRDSKMDSSNPLFSGFDDVANEEKEKYDEPVFARLGITSAEQLQRGFPKDADELFEYNAVILDDLEHDFLNQDQQSLLRQFVTIRGGGLLVLGGQESMRGKGFRTSVLGQLLPVYGEERIPPLDVQDDLNEVEKSPVVRYQLTREGWLQPFLRLAETEGAEQQRLKQMPSFKVLNRTTQIKPGASVLADASVETDNGGLGNSGEESSVPIFVSQRFGKGKTAALMIGDMWRWGLRFKVDQNDADQNAKEAPLYQSWRQIVRWLIADVPRSIEVTFDESMKNSKSKRILIDVKGTDFQSIDNASVCLTFKLPDGKTIAAQADPSSSIAGRYETTITMDSEGVYSADVEVKSPDGTSMGNLQAGWVYQPSATELQAFGEKTQLLESIATATGGRTIALDELETFATDVPINRIPILETKVYPLWHQGWVIITAIGCIGFEWGLRRRYGMA